MAPLVFDLHDLDAKMPCMDKVLHIMRNLEKNVFALQKEPFGLSLNLAIPFEESFCNRREMVEINLHYVGVLLNPYLLHNKELANEQHATDACKHVIRKICKPKTYAQVVKEFVAFRHREPSFHDMLDPTA